MIKSIAYCTQHTYIYIIHIHIHLPLSAEASLSLLALQHVPSTVRRRRCRSFNVEREVAISVLVLVTLDSCFLENISGVGCHIQKTLKNYPWLSNLLSMIIPFWVLVLGGFTLFHLMFFEPYRPVQAWLPLKVLSPPGWSSQGEHWEGINWDVTVNQITGLTINFI